MNLNNLVEEVVERVIEWIYEDIIEEYVGEIKFTIKEEMDKEIEKKKNEEKLERKKEEERLREIQKKQEEKQRNGKKHGSLDECYKGESLYECQKCRKQKKANYWAVNCDLDNEGNWIHCGVRLIKLRKIRGQIKKSQQGYFACCDTYEEDKNINEHIKKYNICNLCKELVNGKKTQANHYNRIEGEDSNCMNKRSIIYSNQVMSYNNAHTFTEISKEEGEILEKIRKDYGDVRYIFYYDIVIEFLQSGKIIYNDKVLYNKYV
jgi:hypothetical protein